MCFEDAVGTLLKRGKCRRKKRGAQSKSPVKDATTQLSLFRADDSITLRQKLFVCVAHDGVLIAANFISNDRYISFTMIGPYVNCALSP